MKKLVLIGAILLLALPIIGQEFSEFTPDQFDKEKNYGSFNFFHVTYHSGSHMTTPEDFTNLFAPGYDAFELRVGTQSTGRQTWQQLHNYPYYGLGVFAGNLGGTDVDTVIGAPSGIYFFFGAPWARFGKFTFATDLAMGLSYDFVPYDLNTNSLNDVIGSTVNLYFNLNAIFYYQLSERYDLSFGLNFFHFSNGRTFTPQRGINMAGYNIGVKYNFNPIKNYTKYIDPDYQPQIRPEFIVSEKPPFTKSHELQFTGSFGTVLSEPGELVLAPNVRDTIGTQERYLTSTFAVHYMYHVARKVKIGGGLDAFYDGSFVNTYRDRYPEDVDFIDKTALGLSFGFHYLIERFTFQYTLGFYVHKNSPFRGAWYQRAGGKVGITDDWDAHIALKTRNGGIADWIEWGVSYKLKL